VWRVVDVNRPVRLWCIPDAVLAALARTVTGGLTSPAPLIFAAGAMHREVSRTLVGRWRGSLPAGCRHAAGTSERGGNLIFSCFAFFL